MSATFRKLVVALAGLLSLMALSYWPGLSGPFLFDDYGNLNVLGDFGRLHSWHQLLYYLSSGNADPTGRPVALLSFLLDAQAWPADPWPFKRTNLVLHLLDTALLALVLAQLQAKWSRATGKDAPRFAPIAAAGLWGAHPFFVSTTLYVIQREAMLPMLFAMLGMLAWTRAVTRFEAGRHLSGWMWAVLGLGGATLLAGLSKANGFLVPALTGLAYLWFLRPVEPVSRRASDRAALACLGIPTLLVLAYLLHVGWSLWGEAHIPARDWTLPQRLLSEPRALWSYLWRLLLPRAGGGGLFVEDFPASRGWLDPATTLPSILALAGITAGAIALRRRFPIATFAWLFFMTAHLVESTVIPLELYFEHRNYLAATMLGWPLAHALLRGGPYPAYRRSAYGLALAVLLLLTNERARVWGDPEMLASLTAAHETGSPRAQVGVALVEIEQGRVGVGLDRLHSLQRREPDSIDIALNTIGAQCQATGALDAETLQRARRAMAVSATLRFNAYQWMQDAARNTAIQQCRGFGLRGLTSLLDSADTNPVNRAPLRMRDLQHVRGALALAENNPSVALQRFDEALRWKPDPDYALTQAAALGNAGAPALGVRHLDYYRQVQAQAAHEPLAGMPGVHAWLLEHFGYYRNELQSLRQQLQSDAARAGPAQRHPPASG